MQALKDALESEDLLKLWTVLRENDFESTRASDDHESGDPRGSSSFDPFRLLQLWDKDEPFSKGFSVAVKRRHLAAFALRHAGFQVSDATVAEVCASNDDQDLCRTLLQCGASVDHVSDDCRNKALFTPDLWTAVESGNKGALRKLAGLWCHPGATKNGRTLVQFARDCGRERIAEYIRALCSTMVSLKMPT